MSGAASLPRNALDRVAERVRSEGRVGLMTHIVLGYPNLDASRAIVAAMVDGGVDIIEVQIPFSDPTADGPTITHASQVALDGGVRVADAFAFVDDVSRRFDTPFVFMSYFNIAFAYRAAASSGRGGGDGVPGFVAAAAGVGASGLILPDVPPEMSRDRYPESCREQGVHAIYVVSPNIGDDRLHAVAKVGTGLLYATSRIGTTGREMGLETGRLGRFLARAREICELPIAVGFSISRREHVEQLAGHADFAVVGSHLIRAHESGGVDGVRRAIDELAGR